MPLRNSCFPVITCSYITSLKIFEGYDLKKVRINSQTQRFAPKAVYGLQWQAWTHFRFPSLGCGNEEGMCWAGASGHTSVLAVPGQVSICHISHLILHLCSSENFLYLSTENHLEVVKEEVWWAQSLPEMLLLRSTGEFIQQLMKFWGPPMSVVRRWLKLHFASVLLGFLLTLLLLLSAPLVLWQSLWVFPLVTFYYFKLCQYSLVYCLLFM